MTEPNPAKAGVDLASGHTVRRYDQELAKLRGIILEMGERVIEQTQAAVAALLDQDGFQAFRVLDREPQVDFLSLDADEEVFRVIVRRQPTAVDLRIVLALSKIADDVERAGDKAVRIARQALELEELGIGTDHLPEGVKPILRRLDNHTCCMFERGIRAVVGFDVTAALGIFEDEPELYDAANEARKSLIDLEPGTLSTRQMVSLLTCIHALDRIGNHATNIAEQVIYVALGQDVRYRNREILIETLRHQGY